MPSIANRFIPRTLAVLALLACPVIAGETPGVTPPAVPAGATYHVDALAGNDAASGWAAAPWRTLARVNRQVFAPGDTLLFKAGCRWQGQLEPQGSGSDGRPIRIDRYGEGALPVIDMGSATGAAILLRGQEFWEICRLEITGGAPAANQHRQGILVLGSGAGRVFHHIVVSDCHIHDLWGLMGGRYQGIDSYTSTAILVASPRGEEVATFDDVRIERNIIERVDRSAIIVWTPTAKASATRVVVRRNRMRDLGGDAILILGSSGALVEYNVVNDSCMRCGGPDAVVPKDDEWYNPCAAAIWLHTCDGAIMQFNEVYDTRVAGALNRDGQAFDFDFNCSHCVLQNNYSRNNAGGWLLIMPSAEHNIARFNISENDSARLMCGGSSMEADNRLYNNTFYNASGTVEVFTNASYTNNIFYASGEGRFTITRRKPGLLSHNIYFGPWVKLPDDAAAVLADPMLVVPGTGGTGLESTAGYRLQDDSPCFNSGVPLGPGERDFAGNPLTEGARLIGAYQQRPVPGL
jgi:hypothetical protein